MREHFVNITHQQRAFLMALSLFLLLILLCQLLLPTFSFSEPISLQTGYIISLVTQSAGEPYFPITILFGFAISYRIRESVGQWFTLCSQFVFLLLIAFILKSGLKTITEVPRPYTNLLTHIGAVKSPDNYYQLTEIDKIVVIKSAEKSYGFWRIKNWLDGTNYAFPSGHTLFAAVFVAFWGGFMIQHKHYFLTAIILVWGSTVAISRIYLAMHTYTDIFVAIACVYFFVCFIPILQTTSKRVTYSLGV